MKKLATLFVALALCMGLAVPAFAAENSLYPDVFSFEYTYEDSVELKAPLYFVWNGTADLQDSGSYRSIADGTRFTVTNLQDDGYVYIFIEPYTMQADSVKVSDADGAALDLKGSYVHYAREYYLNDAGSWAPYDVGDDPSIFNMGTDLNFYADDCSGLLLGAGESVTFTLPNDGTDTIYLLWVCYNNPEINASFGPLTWQWGRFKYDSVSAEPAVPAEPAAPVEPAVPAEPVAPAEPVVPTEPAAPAGGTAEYTIRAGDTLGAIARAYYGEVSLYKALYEANKDVLASADLIYVGQVIALPAALDNGSRNDSRVPAEGETLYTIQAGDTLGTIAKAVYGDVLRYKDIFERNSDILTDANTIYAGQIIVLPCE